MKQLLDSATVPGAGGSYVVAGLDDRAFAGSVLDGGGLLVELEPPEKISAEASPPENAEEEGEEATSAAEQEEDSKDDDEKGEDTAPLKSEVLNPSQVQAVAIVCCQEEQETLLCAVSRCDKSLALYRIALHDAATAHPASPPPPLRPYLVHVTAKRVSSLCFAAVRPSSRNGERGGGKDLTVIVAGDLAGDAVAFSADGDEMVRGGEERRHRSSSRLLLGHTASMLTSVDVAAAPENVVSGEAAVRDGEPCAKRQFLLTSDRDEKIRVSHFPDTHIIHGYLLGHEAFVTSTAVFEGTSRCVSVGGDGTLRLWDFQTCEELATAKLREIADETALCLPTKVAVRDDKIAIIYENSKRLDVWGVRWSSTHQSNASTEKGKLQLHSCCSFQYPTQPLGISFVSYGEMTVLLILARQPDLFYACKLTNQNCQTFSAKEIPFCETLRQKADSFNMPKGLLEKDQHGNYKLKKMNESRGGSGGGRTWNDASRKETSRARNKRSKKRRRRG